MNEAAAGMGELPLPAGIRSRLVPGVNGLTMHVLEAGFEEHGRPCLLLLHGFPELAFSWRKVMLPLAQAGYHVVAPDQRGYGRTIGYDPEYDGDLASYRPLNLVRDVLGLVAALGYRTVDLVGHDFGSPVAAWCALLRPDVFKSVALMSAPFAGVPSLPLGPQVRNTAPDVHAELAALPRPRKHYQWYYSTRQADGDMHHCRQGLHDFMRAYYHAKSADWKENRPYPLAAWSAQELAKLPTYYVMDLHEDMAQTVAHHMPTREAIATCKWMTDEEMRVYSGEFARTGFQAALQWYRCRTTGLFNAEAEVFAGRTIDIPSVFISGKSDWGPYQKAGDVETMQRKACTNMRGCHFIEGAGHWVQQEQPGETVRLLLEFLRKD